MCDCEQAPLLSPPPPQPHHSPLLQVLLRLPPQQQHLSPQPLELQREPRRPHPSRPCCRNSSSRSYFSSHCRGHRVIPNHQDHHHHHHKRRRAVASKLRYSRDILKLASSHRRGPSTTFEDSALGLHISRTSLLTCRKSSAALGKFTNHSNTTEKMLVLNPPFFIYVSC